MSALTYDLIAMGRSSLDLYSNQIGAPFPEIESFAAYVGGCPTNIAVGTRRLGLRSALLTAVGDDPVADFVLRFLDTEGVDTSFIPRKTGYRTSAVLLGIEPPDRFPLVFYREGCADIELSEDDVAQTPLTETAMLLVTGTGLSREPSRSATLSAMQIARSAGARVVLDIDLRADQWTDLGAFSRWTARALEFAHIAIGTEEEVVAAAQGTNAQLSISGSQISSPEVQGDREAAIESLLSLGLEALVMKEGAAGARVHRTGKPPIGAPPFPVEICNVLGAGDAFASGLLYGLQRGWPWERCVRMGNATGAIVVTRPGCANFMPTEAETLAFIDNRGGF